jgi:hypothetical protein
MQYSIRMLTLRYVTKNKQYSDMTLKSEAERGKHINLPYTGKHLVYGNN